MNIPDGLPTIHKGSHRPNDGEACVMEYVSLLAGEQWTDAPLCTLPLIAGGARHINDLLPDYERQGLLILVPRLLTANVEGGRHAEVTMHLIAATRAYAGRRGYHGVLALFSGLDDLRMFTEVCSREAACSRGVEFLTFLLDEFDKVAGRRDPAEVTDKQYAAATKAISAKAVYVEAIPKVVYKAISPSAFTVTFT